MTETLYYLGQHQVVDRRKPDGITELLICRSCQQSGKTEVVLKGKNCAKIDQARKDRDREILRLDSEMRRAQVQPGSELLVAHYQQRIKRLESRNAQGVVHASRSKFVQGHNPPIWL